VGTIYSLSNPNLPNNSNSSSIYHVFPALLAPDNLAKKITAFRLKKSSNFNNPPFSTNRPLALLL
jgi:hypothetical protein